MSSPSIDSAFLSTSPKPTSPSVLPPTSDAVASSDKSSSQMAPKTRQKAYFFIELPVLSASQKIQYRQVPEELKEGATFDRDDIDAIVGEHREGTILYYFVRFKDGLAHKVRIVFSLSLFTLEHICSFQLVTSEPSILT